MRGNAIREAWARGDSVVNGWLSMPGGFSAETMAHGGWDALTVDMQHGVIDYGALVPMLTAIATTRTVPLVRAPWLDAGLIMKILDAGAYGVICPMINTPEDAAAFVRASHYPPRGQRSFGPIRARLYAGNDYAEHANDTIVRFAMIETGQALDDLDRILEVEGLDAVYVGPSDLACSLGHPPVMNPDIPEVVQAIDHILERTLAHGLIAGIHNGSAVQAQRMIDRGFRFVTAGTDAHFLANGSRAVLDSLRRG